MKKPLLLVTSSLLTTIPLVSFVSCAAKSIVVPVQIQITNEINKVIKGQNLKIWTNVTPVTSNKTLTWTSSNPEIASIDENGVVTGHQIGVVDITVCSSLDNSINDSISIFVIDHDDLNRRVFISEYDAENFCLKGIREATPYICNIVNFYPTDSITVTIIPTDDETETLKCSLSDQQGSRVPELTFDGSQQTVTPHVTMADDAYYGEVKDYYFSLKFHVVSGLDLSEYDFIVYDLILTTCNGTSPEHFTYADADQTILTGLNPTEQRHFEQCNFLVIPETVTTIQDYAFYDNTHSKTLIPNIEYLMLDGSWLQREQHLKKIGQHAFYNAPITDEIYIPESVEEIGISAFGLTKIESITFATEYNSIFPHGDPTLTTIDAFAFSNDAFLNSEIVIPKSVTTIGIGAFMQSPLTSITFEKGREKTLTIKSNAFQYHVDGDNCGAASGNFIFPEQVSTIDSSAFSNQGFNHIYGTEYISDNFTWRGYVFYNSLKMAGHLHLPVHSQFTSNSKSFSNCSSINGLHINKETTLTAGNFDNLSSLQVLDLTKIGFEDRTSISFPIGCLKNAAQSIDDECLMVLTTLGQNESIESAETAFASLGLTKDKIESSKNLLFQKGVSITIDESRIEHGSITAEGDRYIAVPTGTKFNWIRDEHYLGYVLPECVPDVGYTFAGWYNIAGERVPDTATFDTSQTLYPKFVQQQ